MTTLEIQLGELAQQWRMGADHTQEQYRGMGPIAGSALATAETMRECAGALEKLLVRDADARPDPSPRPPAEEVGAGAPDACGIGGPS